MMGKCTDPLRLADAARANGTVLIVAMWVALVLAGLALVFTRSMRVEMIASANEVSAHQAEQVARGALRCILARVVASNASPTALEELEWEGVPVGTGRFWVLRPDSGAEDQWDFGMVDEASKISLNAAPADILLRLPGMTNEFAAAIVDWRDGDDDLTAGGAESEYYLLLAAPYYCKNDRFETVEELLLVRDGSRDVLFGEDVNRNGVLDPNEDDAGDTEPPDNRDGTLDAGIYRDVTVYSREPNLDAEGEERANVNSPGGRLAQVLRDAVSGDRYYPIMDRVRGGRPFRNLIDFYYRTGLTLDEFKAAEDKLTASNERTLEGRVNAATAPKRVLMYLPGLDEGDAEALVARRSGSNADLDSIAWVIETLDRDKAIGIGDYITTKSYQFSADIVALSGDGRAMKRYRAVIDAAPDVPSVLFWQDWTHLGWPLSPGIRQAARNAGLDAALEGGD